MSNEIGSRGEFIFAMLLSRRDAVQKSLFKPIFLGDKQPTVDFYVDLLNYPHKKGFFFASVKATTLGYTADGTKLKILVDKAELSELLKYPTPTYLFGQGFLIKTITLYALLLATLKRRAGRKSIWASVFF